MPGCLIPGDLERIQEYVGDHRPEYVLEHFVSSEGATVAKEFQGQTYVFQVPSIVPAQRADGRCVFLTADDQCSIHPVSPFGCGYHDTHMSKEEGDRRMTFCIQSQMADHRAHGPYSHWCLLLTAIGLRAKPLAVRRQAMKELM